MTNSHDFFHVCENDANTKRSIFIEKPVSPNLQNHSPTQHCTYQQMLLSFKFLIFFNRTKKIGVLYKSMIMHEIVSIVRLNFQLEHDIVLVQIPGLYFFLYVSIYLVFIAIKSKIVCEKSKSYAIFYFKCTSSYSKNGLFFKHWLRIHSIIFTYNQSLQISKSSLLTPTSV